MNDRVLIVGLGNPGVQFDGTRHNVGFWLVDRLVTSEEWCFEKKFKAMLLKDGASRFFVKPTTFVNVSGFAVKGVVDYYKIKLENILIIHDEIDFPIGVSKLKWGGSSSHNGIKDIVLVLGTEDFWRLRIGVGRPKYGTVADHVLGKFTAEESGKLTEVLVKIKSHLTDILSPPYLNQVITKFNG